MAASARVMVPIKITEGMVLPESTIQEPNPDTGEVAWVSGQSYDLDQERTWGGGVYVCIKKITSSTVPPGEDRVHWWRERPTDRMAPFDDYSNTKVYANGTLLYALSPGFINGINVYFPQGDTYALRVYDGKGGPLIKEQSGDLYAQAAGFWELLFAPLPALESVSMKDIPLVANTYVEVEINSPLGGKVGVGDIKVGDWRQFLGDVNHFGGVEYGAEATRKSYTYRKENDDGTWTQVPRGHARNVNCTVAISSDEAMYADALLGEIINIAVPFEATDLPKYGYLNTLGFVTGSIRADNWGKASIALTVKGTI